MRDFGQGVAVGFFDGVHLGHRQILAGAKVALTFRNHPLSLLAPDRAPQLIMSCEERVAAIRACGVDEVTVVDFTRELADLSPDEFVLRHLPQGVIRCGANWRFGRGGEGSPEWLRTRGRDVVVVPFAVHDGEPVSSTRIRASLAEGRIEDANAMLGRAFGMRGAAFAGKGVGSQIGFPTVNLRLDGGEGRVSLAKGVYEVELRGLRGIANYGFAPTMDDRAWAEPVLEVHFPKTDSAAVPDFADGVRVEFRRFVRPERKFASVEDLRRQIAADCGTISA